MKTPLNLRRRQFLATAAGLGGLLAAPLASARSSGRQPVVVVTSYNDETFSRFEAAFEKANPRYKLQLVWRMPHDALPYLRQPAQGGADVYWAASPRTFATLAADGAWQPLGIARDGLPENIGNARLSDANGLYTATEMAGYGFIVNPGALARLGLAEPKDWRDLMLKDLGLAMNAALDSRAATPMGALARNIFDMHSKAGAGGLDFSSVFTLLGRRT